MNLDQCFQSFSLNCLIHCVFSFFISVEKKKETITESAGRQQKKKIGKKLDTLVNRPPPHTGLCSLISDLCLWMYYRKTRGETEEQQQRLVDGERHFVWAERGVCLYTLIWNEILTGVTKPLHHWYKKVLWCPTLSVKCNQISCLILFVCRCAWSPCSPSASALQLWWACSTPCKFTSCVSPFH